MSVQSSGFSAALGDFYCLMYAGLKVATSQENYSPLNIQEPMLEGERY